MRNLFLVILLLSQSVLFAQKTDFGISFASNINFIELQSDYKIADDVKFNPRVGKHFSVVAEIPISEKFVLYNSLGYSNLNNSDKQEFKWKDELGEEYFLSEKRIIKNRNAQYAFIPTLKLNKVSIGSGAIINFLYKSKTKFHDHPDEEDIEDFLDDWEHSNKYYKKLSFCIPFKLSYNYEFFNIYMQFRKVQKTNYLFILPLIS